MDFEEQGGIRQEAPILQVGRIIVSGPAGEGNFVFSFFFFFFFFLFFAFRHFWVLLFPFSFPYSDYLFMC